MLGRKELKDNDTLVCIAVLVYTTYITTNKLRRIGNRYPQPAGEALGQNILEAIRGHPRSEKIVNGRWVSEVSGKRRRNN